MKTAKTFLLATVAAASFSVLPTGAASANQQTPETSGMTTEPQPSTLNDIQVSPFGSCGQTFDPLLPGAGQAHWTLRCKNGNITVEGWVQDNYGDGECVAVKAHFPGEIWEYSKSACTKGLRLEFKWTHPGDIADVYLYEHDA